MTIDLGRNKMDDIHDQKNPLLYTIKWRHNLLEDRYRAKKMLDALEYSISKRHSVVIVADVVPTFHLAWAIEHLERNVDEISTFSRLADVLCRFETYRIDEYPTEEEGEPYAVAKEARFSRQWLASTQDERVQLYALAGGGFVNQKRVAVLSSLLNRGLVEVKDARTIESDKCEGEGKANKVVALRDPEFGDYIRDNLDHDELKAWQREGHGSIWRKIWPPLTAIAVLALLFFLNANPEALGILLALLGATVGAVPIAISLARSWRSSGQSDSAD